MSGEAEGLLLKLKEIGGSRSREPIVIHLASSAWPSSISHPTVPRTDGRGNSTLQDQQKLVGTQEAASHAICIQDSQMHCDAFSIVLHIGMP